MTESTFSLEKQFIKARALSLGFCLCGITDNAPLAEYSRYENWIQSGQNAEMSYLATPRHRLPRQDPTQLVPWVNSIIVLAWPYRLNRAAETTPSGQIAGYVGSLDYHLLMQQKAQALIDCLREATSVPFQAQVFSDSSPILERELAVRAGLGWIGRNSCLISPEFGSAFVLAEVFLDLPLQADEPFSRDLCGTCSRCRQACPTACIAENRTLEAGRCISTLTIENKGVMPQALEKNVGSHIFGCDICQAVCPWNRKILAQEESLAQMSPEEMIAELKLSDTEFKLRYQDSPILRAKRRGWVRNLCTVLTNLNYEPAYEPLSHVLATDPEPICRISAARAIIALDPKRASRQFEVLLQSETDALVKTEIIHLTTKNSLQ